MKKCGWYLSRTSSSTPIYLEIVGNVTVQQSVVVMLFFSYYSNIVVPFLPFRLLGSPFLNNSFVTYQTTKVYFG